MTVIENNDGHCHVSGLPLLASPLRRPEEAVTETVTVGEASQHLNSVS